MAHADHCYCSPGEILAALPHRQPFLFIDKVESLQLRRAIHAVKNVTYADVCGDSGMRQLPCVYLLECFGQAGVLLVAAERRDANQRLGVLLGTIDSFEVSGDVVCGDTVDIEVQFAKRTSKMAILEGRALVRGAPIAQAGFTAYFDWKSLPERDMQSSL